MIATRDKNVLLHIVEYCNQTDETVDLFGKSYETFVSSHTYRNACCLCLLQIGELVNALSEEFRDILPHLKRWGLPTAMAGLVLVR